MNKKNRNEPTKIDILLVFTPAIIKTHARSNKVPVKYAQKADAWNENPLNETSLTVNVS